MLYFCEVHTFMVFFYSHDGRIDTGSSGTTRVILGSSLLAPQRLVYERMSHGSSVVLQRCSCGH